MSLRRAKSVDDLYEEVAAFDLVLVPDGPLASAITNRLDRPYFGTFATTPRRYAAGRRERAEDRTAFLEVIHETDHSWRAVAYAIGNVLQCWEHQGHLESILEYDAYVDDVTRDVVEHMKGLETTSHRLATTDIDPDQDVAVVDADQFTPLERRQLPDTATEIDLFTAEALPTPTVHSFETSTAIVDALRETITPENAENVAIVLDEGSQYAALVESTLETADIPFYGGPGFLEDRHHRTLLRLLQTAFRGPGITVADIAPVLSSIGESVSIEHANKRLETVDSPAVDWLRDFVADPTEYTLAEAVEIYETAADCTLDAFRTELERLDITDEPLSDGLVDDLAFYFQTYEVPVERDNAGVLLADATAAGYVDRPVTFHIGLADGWNHSAPNRPWVDPHAQFDRHCLRFQRLIQSGQEQYYLVQEAAGGQPVTPCLYLRALLDESPESFRDLHCTPHTRFPRTGGDGFERTSVPALENVAATTVETISQSSLNSYVNSPRDYLFGRLLDSPDKDYFVEGNLFHDFAEFAVAHPSVVADASLADCVDAMLAEIDPFIANADRPLYRRKFRIGLETILEYLAANPPTTPEFLTATSGWGTNFFATYFDREVASPITEHWFENESVGVRGIIDLIHGPDHLLDYKSGSKKSRRQVVKGSAIDPPADTPNFQAALYLAHYRTVQPNQPLEFTFFHFLETLDDVIAGEPDLEDCLTTVTYYPFTFDEYVGSREAYELLLDGYNDCQETFEDLGYPAYSDIMAQLSFPETTEKAALLDSNFATRFTDAVDVATSEGIDVAKGCEQAIRALNSERKKTYFVEDLDAFEAFLEERLAELNARRAGEERFPVEGLGGEPNYRRVDHRDLLLEGHDE